MLVRDFLLMLIDDALEDARFRHLQTPGELLEFQGSCCALSECSSRMMGDEMPRRLASLLENARADSARALEEDHPDKQYWFAREVQVEWISEVVSVILLQNRLQVIVPPTKGAAMAAARIVGALE